MKEMGEDEYWIEEYEDYLKRMEATTLEELAYQAAFVRE